MPLEDDDPVIASYDVYISPQQSTDLTKPSSNIYILQYPSHRPSSKPYSSRRSQKPTSLRIKPTTGLIEVDIPLLTSENYNHEKGSQFGRSVHDARSANPHISHGMSGGFAQNQSSINQPTTLSSIPAHDAPISDLQTQVLGGKISNPTDQDPVYMLATMHTTPTTQQIHLTHLDALIQMRPQLHHIDAADDLKRRADLAEKSTKPKLNGTTTDPNIKLETRAIELKVRDPTKEDPKDRNLNLNARLLREIQNDTWVKHDWIERHDHQNQTHTSLTHLPTTTLPMNSDNNPPPPLRATLDNDTWLNKMSTPGIELRTRLKGRDRERARRKRQERLRGGGAKISSVGSTAAQATSTGPFATELSASESESSEDDGDEDEDEHPAEGDEEVMISREEERREVDVDVDMGVDGGNGGRLESNKTMGTDTQMETEEVQIKQESSSTAAAVAPTPTSPARRRGRPKKSV